jgi:hypothetical protein
VCAVQTSPHFYGAIHLLKDEKIAVSYESVGVYRKILNELQPCDMYLIPEVVANQPAPLFVLDTDGFEEILYVKRARLKKNLSCSVS